MKKFYLGIAFAILLGGCATAQIVPVGGNTYMISQTSAGGMFTNMGALKTKVIQRANAFAESKGKVAVPIATTTTRPVVGGFPNFEYQFILVDKDDPRANSDAPVPDTFRR